MESSPDQERTMPRSSAGRWAPALSGFLENRLCQYSTAALVAGVSTLALTPAAEGTVVITRESLPIPVGQTVAVDLDHNGIDDFEFTLSSNPAGCNYSADLTIKTRPGGGVMDTAGAPRPYASALLRGARIGPSAHFSSTQRQRVTIERSQGLSCSGATRRNLYGNWGGNPPNRYLGVKFLIQGTPHFGWIRISVNFEERNPNSATITAFGYETIPGKKVLAGIAPQELLTPDAQSQAQAHAPSLGMLALGAEGLPLWRREVNSIAK
jgi:hypothetical protein